MSRSRSNVYMARVSFRDWPEAPIPGDEVPRSLGSLHSTIDRTICTPAGNGFSFVLRYDIMRDMIYEIVRSYCAEQKHFWALGIVEI